MKYSIICCLILLSTALTSCKKNVLVKNATDMEAIPVRMIETADSLLTPLPPTPPPPAEKKIKYYKLVKGDATTIEVSISNEIANGWQPIGGISIAGKEYVQAMVMFDTSL